MTDFAQPIIDRLIAKGRGEELKHPNAGLFWNGTEDDIRYVCWTCGSWFYTVAEVETHIIGVEH